MGIWIIDKSINKVRKVALGSAEMNAASNVYDTEARAAEAFKLECEHPTRLANSKTGRVVCADCRTQLEL